MAIPNVTPYSGQKPIPGQDQPTFNQNMSDELDYFNALPAELNPAIDAMNQTATDVDNAKAAAETAASEAATSATAAAASGNYQGDFTSGVTSATAGESYSFGDSTWLCLVNTTTDPAVGNSNWRKVVSVEDVNEAEERLLGPGAKIYRGSNGQYVRNGDIVPSENPPYTHLSVPINGKAEDVAMSPIAAGAVSGLTETGATIGGVSVSLRKDLSSFRTIVIRNGVREREIREKAGDFPALDDYLLPGETEVETAVSRAVADNVYELFGINRGADYNVRTSFSLPDDFVLTGIGRPSVVFDSGITNAISMNSRNKLSGFIFSGGANGVICPGNGGVDSSVSDMVFNGQNQIILLYACSDFDVSNSTFDGCGYGVIQQLGFASNGVRVFNNTARALSSDFVEANSASVDTMNWEVIENIFLGSAGYPTSAIESRFVGFTSVQGVIVKGNIVMNVAGDSAVHLEDTLGVYDVSHNIFIDAFLNQGAIYNLSSDKDVLIQSNWFVMTDNYPFATENNIAIRTDSNNYNHRILTDSNWFVDLTTGGKHLVPVKYGFGGGITHSNNQCINTYDVGRHQNVNGLRWLNNRAHGQVQRGIWSDTAATGSAGNGVEYIGNKIPNIVEQNYGIRATTNTNGTLGPIRHYATLNSIGGDIRIENISGAPGQTAENVETNNRYTGSVVVSNRVTPNANGSYLVTAIE